MTLTARILLVFLVIGGLTLALFLDRILVRIERQYMEAAEEPMVDAANLLAGVVAGEMTGEGLPDWDRDVAAALLRNPRAQIYSKFKDQIEMDFYLTDGRGVVLYDSSGQHPVGSDYAANLDVFHTLRGRYGARSTRQHQADDRSSVMYVAAPIIRDGSIVGVLTVYKPQHSLHAFIRETRRVLQGFAVVAMGAMLAGGFLASRWITSPVRALTDYVEAVAVGQKPRRPRFASRSMDSLASAFETMRDAVEGRRAIETYVQTLTHEMKSPVAAIRGAAELLEEPMPEEQRNKFLANIRSETERLANLTERLLQLSAVENCKELETVESVDLGRLLSGLADDARITLENKTLSCQIQAPEGLTVRGDAHLLKLAGANLLQNALDFAPRDTPIILRARREGTQAVLEIEDRGPGIPEYARRRVFERFYSLPRPGSGQKSTGLGLCFVRETALLHHGTVELLPAPGGGTLARLSLPISKT